MNLFDIVGPVMVGPSSSHTAGAVRIGYISRRLLGEPVKKAQILLYGSFLATGKGHGTDRAIIAGLLGMKPDDMRIPDSMELAEKAGMEVSFGEAKCKDAHPNTAQLILTGTDGNTLEIEAASLGGGRIRVCKIDGIETNFCGDYPTLIVHNLDQPGHVTEVTSMLAHKAEAEGRFVADLLLGRTPLRGVAPIPACVYTSPELAQVGLTADEARARGIPCAAGKCVLSGSAPSDLPLSGRNSAALCAGADHNKSGRPIYANHCRRRYGVDSEAEPAESGKCEAGEDK